MEITVIDSGLGGITFSENVKKEIKYLDIKPLIDKDGFPYGNKDLMWLKERLISLVDESTTDNVIIACNTLSSIIFHFDLNFNKRVVDVITPTIYFLINKKYQKLCILATSNTIKMDIYRTILEIDIIYLDTSKLINTLERNIDFNKELDEIVKKIPKDCDSLLLGCTHLIKIKEAFREKLFLTVISQDEIFVSLFQ